MPYTQFLAARALWLVSGTVSDAGEHLSWKMVLKVVSQGDSGRAMAAGQADGMREIAAYRSGLLDDLPGNLRAPRAVHIEEVADGEASLWLEHIADHYDRRWPLPYFGVAARHLGRFNGAYLTNRPMPNAHWRMKGWAEWQSEPERALTIAPMLEQLLLDPRVEASFPVPIADRARRLLRDQPHFLDILAQLPQTLCHHDAAQVNLFARQRRGGEFETVAIDWECIGPGTIGADLASLVFSTLRRGDVASAHTNELERLALAGYLAGLRDAGWHGPSDQVRLGYVSAVALRWSLLLGTLRDVVDDQTRLKAARDWRIPAEMLLRQWVQLSITLLDRADEVHRLADTVQL
jgi:hypothetical protein